MATGQQDLSPTSYEIRIKGHLDPKWAEWFYDLALTHESDGTTTLRGPLPDQTALHSVLDRIRDMNLPLVSVTQIQPDSEDGSPTGASGDAPVD
jgi:hypothetical protein